MLLNFLQDWKFVIPGLFSTYALQSSGLLYRHVSYTSASVECPWYDHVLAYQTFNDAAVSCETLKKPSLLVSTNTWGSIIGVHEVLHVNGDVYEGSLYGVATSPEHGVVWACGRVDNRTNWKIMRFGLGAVLAPSGPITMLGEDDAPSIFKNAETCSLFWRPSTERRLDAKDHGHLWITGHTPKSAKGFAYAYLVTGPGAVRTSFRQKSIKVGKFITGLAFHLNMFDDTFVCLARCPKLRTKPRGGQVPRCLLTAHSTAHCPLPTAHCPLPTVHYLLLTTHYLLLTAHYFLPTIYCLQLTTCYLLLTTHYSLLTTYNSLLTTYYLLLRFHAAGSSTIRSDTSS